jgi:hypothetical protein
MNVNILGTPTRSAPDNFVRCTFCFLFSQENSFVIVWWKADAKIYTAEAYSGQVLETTHSSGHSSPYTTATFDTFSSTCDFCNFSILSGVNL